MTDTSHFGIPLEHRLTQDMQYGLKPSALPSRSTRLSLTPNNGTTFTPNSQIKFDIPVGKGLNCFLDHTQSYKKFGVQFQTTAAANAGGTGVYLDNSAYSFFQQQIISHVGQPLETLNQYGQFANFWLDCTLNRSQKAGLSAMIGTNPYTNLACVATNAAVSYGGSTATSIINQTEGDRSGLSVTTTTAIATSPVYNFCLPIMSGIIGANASKMLPMNKLSSALQLEYYLSANDDAVYYGTAGAGCTWQIVNMELELCYVNIDTGMDLIPRDDLYISSSTYRQASATITSTQSGDINIIVPFRYTSLNAMYVRFRNQASAVQGANATAAARLSCSINPNLSYWQFKMGQSVFPIKPVYQINGYITGSGAEAFTELQKSFRSLTTISGEPAIKANEYNVSATAYTNGQWTTSYQPGSRGAGNQGTETNAYAIGLELQSYSNRTDSIFSGVNCQNTTNFYFTGTIYTGLTAGGASGYNYTVDMFGTYDFVIKIDQFGIMTVIV
jgi:hypothetical protein